MGIAMIYYIWEIWAGLTQILHLTTYPGWHNVIKSTVLDTVILIVYNLFSYLLLYISCILFGIATIIFINACFNLNKVSTGREGTFIDKPIFEYLKKDDIQKQKQN